MKNKTIFISGHFNVLHPGHLRLFRFAKECGNKLIVGVEADCIAGDAAYVSEKLRLEGVQSNSWIDEAFLIDKPLVDILIELKPDVVVKGKEYETKFNIETDVVKKYGGILVFGSGGTVFSSIDLIRREFLESHVETIHLPDGYIKRHGISIPKLVAIVEDFSKLKVCVIGDLIVDEYITCQALGMSQEDPTIVVTPIDSRTFVGGAGIVSAHAAGLGADVQFFSVTGNDESREFSLKNLSDFFVKSHLFVDETRPTTLKKRFRSKGKTLLRVNYLHQREISTELQEKMLKTLENIIPNIDLLVFSDFNYGCLPQVIVDQIISLAKLHKVLLVADSQSSSQVGDISRFKGMDLITPTEYEARISTHNQRDGLVVLAEELKKQSDAAHILLKIGEEGLLIHSDKRKEDWLTDRIDALNCSPKDVIGAGDSLLIASAMTLASGGTIWEAALLGSLAAAIQVGRVGNTPLKIKEFLTELKK